MNEQIKSLQRVLFPSNPEEWDGIWGPKSAAALDAVIHPSDGWHNVKASSFADPADVRAYDKCKAAGNSDHYCYGFGDNAVGCWEDSTREGTGPSVALPPEDWEQFGTNAHLKKVEVRYGDKTVIAELKDTMPHKANIKNGAGIDMNPDTCAALGLTPPVMVKAAWRWI